MFATSQERSALYSNVFNKSQASWAGMGSYWFRGTDIYLSGAIARLGSKQEVFQAAERSQAGGDDEQGDELFQYVKCCLYSVHDNRRQNDNLPWMPDRIVVFRDGTGVGQFPAVQSQEISQVRKAVRSVQQDSSNVIDVPITFVLCTKRIKQSMVQMSIQLETFVKSDPTGNRLVDAIKQGLLSESHIGNGPFGGVVNDSRICLDPKRDFYLFSLNSSPATVRSVHYHIVVDDEGPNSKSLGWEGVSATAFKLGHLYYNWPGPILIPSPTQYAHAAAFLASEVFGPQVDSRFFRFHSGLACL